MRKCCIEGCLSKKSSQNGPSFFEITSARSVWLDIIKQHQQLKEGIKLYICDLHFKSDDIKRCNNTVTLKKNALPHISLRSSNESAYGSNAGTCDSNSNDTLEFPVPNIYEDDEPECDVQTITIPLHEYNMLLNGVNSELLRYQNSINKMDSVIRSKDAELKRIQIVNKREQAQCINVSNLSAEQREVLDCLANGIRKPCAYPESVRKFCLQQKYYSTAAYKSLRSHFNNNLPAIRTMQMWYSSVDGAPGVSESALSVLREKSQSYLSENNHPLHVCLIWDEMSIRKQLTWSNESKSFIGFCTKQNKKISTNNVETEDSQQPNLAKEALVWMVTGPDFKLAIAYELVNGLNGEERAALMLNVIKCVEETGVVIVSVTGDGLPANITAYETLGVNFDEQRTYFMSPTYATQKIYVIFDPPHMLKMVRKHFASNKIYHQNKLIDWSLLETIVARQSKENFNLCNKLTTLHINWRQKPMSVKIAAETISTSVADTIATLRNDGYDEFKDSEATEHFLRMFNDAFDILNFAPNGDSNGKYKQKLCEETAEGIFEFADIFQQYLSELKFQDAKKSEPILISRAERGFAGFYINFSSLRGIYEDFILNGPLKEFYTFQFSQDHLETYFSLVRNSLGSNDNPDPVEFSSASKELLVCHPLLTSRDHNVLSNATGILTVSSRKIERLPPVVVVSQVPDLELQYETVMLTALEEAEPYERHMCAYIALCVEESFIEKTKSHKYKCKECAAILLSRAHKINDELLSMKSRDVGQIQQPSASTLKIVIFGNAIVEMYSEEHRSSNNINVICRNIINNIDTDDLYNDDSFSHIGHEDSAGSHKVEFIRMMVQTFVALKSRKICKKITDEEKGELIRHKKKREVILRGQ